METTLKNFVVRIIHNRIKKGGKRFYAYTSIMGKPVVRINIRQTEMNEQLFDYISNTRNHSFTTTCGLKVMVGLWEYDEVFIAIHKP